MTEHAVVKGKLVCVALNDNRQLTSLSETFSAPPHKAPPQHLVLYYKTRNTWNSDGATLDWLSDKSGGASGACVIGASLGVVIGKTACRVSTDEAMDYVSGVTLVHDFSLPETSYFRPDIRGKCQDGSAPVGAVNADILGLDLDTAEIETRVNDKPASSFSYRHLHRGVARVISELSHIMTLQPGEVIAPGFAGERVSVTTGDVVVSTIEGVGTLTNSIGGSAGGQS